MTSGIREGIRSSLAVRGVLSYFQGGRLRRRARREIRVKLRALAVRQLKALALRRLDRVARGAAVREGLSAQCIAHALGE